MTNGNVMALILAIIVFGYLGIHEPASTSPTVVASASEQNEHPLTAKVLQDFPFFSPVLPAPTETETTTPSPVHRDGNIVQSGGPARTTSVIQSGGDSANTVPEFTVESKAALLVDESGASLYAKNQNKIFPIASLTKLMTAIVAIDRAELHDIVMISEQAIETEGDVVGFRAGEEFSISNLVSAMLIPSSNDAAIALEEYFLEKNTDLVSAMNEKAKEIGMTKTHFKNPSGLDEEGHASTAYDLSLLVRYTLNDKKYDSLWETSRLQSAEIISKNIGESHHLESSNKLLGEVPDIYGGKTGKTQNAGECIALIMERNGKKYIGIILGSTNRFEEMKNLLALIKE